MELIDDGALEQSGVVANCRMNRERSLTGSNGYARDLRFDPLDFTRERAASLGHVRWLDLCCGTGRALVEASRIVESERLEIEIVGVDLVEMFEDSRPRPQCLRFVQAFLSRWAPQAEFDLITCVHGLHYIGDKLGLIARALSWLTKNGRFAANLDMQNVTLQGGRSAGRAVARELRENGIEYDFRTKLVRCEGRRSLALPFNYLGADDQAGPNCTGQPAVDSYYARSVSTG
jgi:trans-aconitate methyltransferase